MGRLRHERQGDVYAAELKAAPSEYFKRQCFVSVECDEEPVKYVIDAIGDDRLEGEALVSFTLFAEANGADSTRVQLNSKMRTQGHRKGDSGKLRVSPVYPCASTGRFEANLVDAVRELVKE